MKLNYCNRYHWTSILCDKCFFLTISVFRNLIPEERLLSHMFPVFHEKGNFKFNLHDQFPVYLSRMVNNQSYYLVQSVVSLFVFLIVLLQQAICHICFRLQDNKCYICTSTVAMQFI